MKIRTLEMPFPAIWALNYELQYDFKKGKTLEIVPYFSFFCTPVDQGQQGCAPPYKSTPDFEVCDYTILPSSTGLCRLKKYAVPSVFKLEFKPQSIPKEARSRLEMPEGSSTHQGHKRPMSHEHLLSTIYHHRIGRYSRSVTRAKLCLRFSN